MVPSVFANASIPTCALALPVAVLCDDNASTENITFFALALLRIENLEPRTLSPITDVN